MNNLSVHSSQLIRLAAAVENAPKKQEGKHRLSPKANGNLKMATAMDYGNYVKNHVRWGLISNAVNLRHGELMLQKQALTLALISC